MEDGRTGDAVRRALREMLEADGARGELRPLAEVRRLFSGHEALVEEEYARAAAAPPSASPPEASRTLTTGGGSPPGTIPGPSAPAAPATVGPYEILAELGSGGMGRVFRARTLRPAAGVPAGTVVALKVVHPDLLRTEGFFKRFLREAELGRRLRHENVVRTLDADALVVGGEPWNFLVMEFVEGCTLRRLLAEMGRVPEALLREIGRQVAAGLAAIHAEGIVHRDLKPENVLLTPDHRIRIMDLGVARLQEASIALTREGQFTGTLLYAAPEQFSGGAVGPAADLYAAGVMLYELATGANPFARDTTQGVLAAHLAYRPPPAADREPAVTPFLSDLLDALVEKDPAARPSSAAEVHAVLEQGERSAWWSARTRERLRAGAGIPAPPVPRETGLHGRAADLETLREAWEEARAGRGGVLLLEGEAGIGKTRLLDEFLRRHAGADAHALYGACSSAGGLGGIPEAVLGKFGAAGMEEAMAPCLAGCPGLAPGFAAALRHEPPPPGAARVEGEALETACAELVKGLAAERPLLWIVDDAHHAGAPGRGAILSMARVAHGRRVLLLLSARPGLPEEFLAQVGRAGPLRRLPLGRVDGAAVAGILRDAFRSTGLAERLGDRIGPKADGVPLFVLEMVHALREGGLLEGRADGSYEARGPVSEIPVPSTVKDLVAARLAGLSREDRDLLDAAAVVGDAFDPSLVGEILGIPRIPLLQRLGGLERATRLVRSAGVGFAFDHRAVREALVDGLAPALRKELHGEVAARLAARATAGGKAPKDAPGEAAVAVVRHHLRGSRPLEAGPFLEGAFRHLEGGMRIPESAELKGEALEIPGLLEGSLRGQTLLDMSGLLERQGRMPEAQSLLEQAEAIAVSCGDSKLRRSILTVRAFRARALGRKDEALALCEEAVREAVVSGDPAGLCQALHFLGSALEDVGRGEEALGTLEKALRMARENRNASLESGVLVAMAGVHRSRKVYAAARDCMERAVEVARGSGDRGGEASHLFHLAQFLETRGWLEEGLRSHESSMALSREVGYRLIGAISSMRAGDLLVLLGDPERAEGLIKEAQQVFREIQFVFLEVAALKSRGLCSLASGNPADADRWASEACSVVARHGADPIAKDMAVQALPIRAEALALLGRTAEAGRILEEAEALSRRNGQKRQATLAAAMRTVLAGGEPAPEWREPREEEHLEASPVNDLLLRWWLWRATGERHHLAGAWRLLGHLREHAPPRYRGSMMEKVPLHRDLAAAAREAGLA